MIQTNTPVRNIFDRLESIKKKQIFGNAEPPPPLYRKISVVKSHLLSNFMYVASVLHGKDKIARLATIIKIEYGGLKLTDCGVV